MGNPRDDGGPAFPHSGSTVYGMSLRDWYAGMALQAMIAKSPFIDREGEHGSRLDQKEIDQFRDDMAESAFEYADAMLKERSDGQPQ